MAFAVKAFHAATSAFLPFTFAFTALAGTGSASSPPRLDSTVTIVEAPSASWASTGEKAGNNQSAQQKGGIKRKSLFHSSYLVTGLNTGTLLGVAFLRRRCELVVELFRFICRTARVPSMRSKLISSAACSKLESERGMEFPLRGQPLKPASRLITPANTDRARVFSGTATK